MRLLLHVCCGPCAIMPIVRLRAAGHELTCYFANPNIHPLSEYLRRREAMTAVAAMLAVPVIWQDDVYNLSGWLAHVHEQGLAANTDGARCDYCYLSRLTLTAAAARAHGFDGFSSSLLYSRHQRHERICEMAVQAAGMAHVLFHYADFRPDWQEGIDRSKEAGIFRQNYCGCIFSEEERFAKKIEKLVKNAG